MRFIRDFKSMWVMGSVLVVLVGFCLAPSLGLARVEMADGVGDVQGDPSDGLGSCGSEGDPVDGLGFCGEKGDPRDGLDRFLVRKSGSPGNGWESRGSVGDPEDGLDGYPIRLLGDPGDGMDLPGDPDDGLDYFRIYCDPGYLILGYGFTPFFGYFRVP